MTKAIRLVVAFVLMLVATTASAGDFAELQIINGQPTGDLYVSGKVHGQFGWSAFALVNKAYGEVYAGPTFAPAKWLAVSVSLGVEAGGTRFAQSLWVGKGRVSVLAIHEDGATGSWHKIVAEATVANGLKAGIQAQAFRGLGPRLSFTKGKVTGWSALLMQDGTKPTWIVALNVSN